VKNYAGDITDAFTCIAALGDQGCGFEGQLKSVRWALDPLFIPPGNQGFMRPDAVLAVILITNEDDCSLPDDSDLIDVNQTRMSDPLGPLWSFRCNEFGHLCNIGGVLQRPPRGAADNLQGCISNEGPTGKLTKIADEVAFLKSLKSDPNNILVAAIAGPVEPYGMDMIMQGADIEPHPNVRHSCTQNSGEYGDPAVRIQQWVQAFGVNGVLQPICALSFAPALMTIADKIGGALGPKCVPGPFTINPTTNQPNCRVVDRFGGPSVRVDTVLKNCTANGNTPPCWTLEDDAGGFTYGLKAADGAYKGQCASQLEEKSTGFLGGTLGKQNFKVLCECAGPAQASFTIAADTISHYQGTVNARSASYKIEGVYTDEKGSATSDPIGYHVHGSDAVGAVEVTGKGRVWLNKSLDAGVRADFACLFAGLLLYKPPTAQIDK
jgi:hypothetical protein